MQNFINFFLAGYTDIDKMAALILSIFIIEEVIDLFRTLFRFGGR